MLKGVLVKEIRELEARRICEDVKFANLIPVSCYRCGNKDNFARRLFKIEGVPESKYADDEIQNDLEKYFKKKYSIEFIFFKTYGKDKDYMVDSAICKKCKSTAITYDLSQNAIDIMSKHFLITHKTQPVLTADRASVESAPPRNQVEATCLPD